LAQAPDIGKIAELVFSGGTALAGLVLVYLGFLIGSFETYRPEQQRAVREKYQRRAVLGLIGFAASLLAAVLALSSYWGGPAFVYIGLIALGLSFLTVFVTGLSSVGAMWS
jgi:hypothetical protein